MSKQPNLAQQIEAALFVNNYPMQTGELAKKLEAQPGEIQKALSELQSTLSGRGICVIESGSGYELAVAPHMREVAAKFTSDSAPTLSQSSLEVLTIIAYEGPCAKTVIDDIRGTPSDNSLRALLSRDLIAQQKIKGNDSTIHYEPTSFAWRSLGITGRAALPPKPQAKKRNAHASE